VDLLAFMPLDEMGGGSANDIWGWTDPLTNREYALVGRTTGTAFIEISDPENPTYLGDLPPHSSNSLWRDIKVYSNHALIVSEATGHGMQVFDLTELRDVTLPPVTFLETAHYDGFGHAHNLAINAESGFAYALDTSSCAGLHMIDIRTPTNPTFAGCYSEAGTHDAQCVNYAGPDTDHLGREVCFNADGPSDTFAIVDVTDKTAPFQLARATYVGVGYPHQGWLTEDQRYFLLGDELDEINAGHNTRTYIWDVSDLDTPVLIDYYQGPTPAIDHNLYTRGQLIYEANYRAGLRVLDPAEIASGTLTEVAYFDIYPEDDDPSFNGAWSVYPFFESGVVVVSGIEQGLFVLRPPITAEFDLSADPTGLAVCTTGVDESLVSLTPNHGYSGSVSLDTVGLPQGAVSEFSLNPITVPGTAAMTLTVSGAAPGLHSFHLSAGDGTLTRTVNMTLDVQSGPPLPPAPLSPPEGAVEVSTRPTFTWDPPLHAGSFTLEIGLDASFSTVVYAITVSGNSHTPAINLEPETIYFWRVRAQNACGEGDASAPASFETRTVPPILLVDDDLDPDVQGYYTAALTALNMPFDVWEVGNDTSGSGGETEPGEADLQLYELVIWFTGSLVSGAGPGPEAETALGAFLDGAGCLFLNSQNYHATRGITPFMAQHLGVAGGSGDRGYSTVTGQGAAFGSFGPYELELPFPNQSDGIAPSSGSEVAFIGDEGGEIINAGVLTASNGYRATYWGFPFEGIPGSAVRRNVMGAILDWCGFSFRNVTLGSNQQLQGRFGTSITYTLPLTNLGNLTDTYHLTVKGDWPTSLTPTVSPALAPGEGTTLTLIVDIPEAITDGDTETTSITAVSSVDGNIFTGVMATTTGVWYRGYLPLFQRE
jgi:choice-of-anchor B domain-containing protein